MQIAGGGHARMGDVEACPSTVVGSVLKAAMSQVIAACYKRKEPSVPLVQRTFSSSFCHKYSVTSLSTSYSTDYTYCY